MFYEYMVVSPFDIYIYILPIIFIVLGQVQKKNGNIRPLNWEN